MTAGRTLPRVFWAVPFIILTALAVAQIPLFRFGEKIGASFDRTRASILRSQVSGAFLKVSNIDAIQPFYLRCVPFLLFSDRELIAKNLIFFTEWHDQLRHPTRLVENWFDLGRPRFRAQFYATDGIVDVRLEPGEANIFTVPTGMWQATRIEAAQAQQQAANREGRLGLDLLSAGCFRDAIEHFQTALQLKPDFAEAHHDLAVALSQTGRVSEAVDHLGAAIQAKPTYLEAYIHRGMLLISAARKAEAIDQFRAALRLAPGDPAVHFYLGLALAQNNSVAEAVEHYRSATVANPQFFEAEFNLGQLLLQSGQMAEAATHFRAATKIRPDDVNARTALEHLPQK